MAAEDVVGEGASPWAFWLGLALFVVVVVAVVLRRQARRVERGRARVDQLWAEVEKALDERLAALEAMHQALSRAGLVPEARPHLKDAIQALREARPRGPRALAEAHDRTEAVLTQIYRALPRERLEDVRQAQNRLAQADEELDIVRTQYNETVFLWVQLVQRWTYRTLARRKGLTYPEPFLLPEEDADFVRRRLTP